MTERVTRRMSDTRSALLIGCSDYTDPNFRQLPAPVQDVDAFRRVLADPEIGEFAVETVLNKPSWEVSEQIDHFFSDRKPDDLLLLYFSCHGVLNDKGKLYFATTNTKEQRLGSTAISAHWVKEQLDHSRSQRIVLLLDCCYSGAFAKGPKHGSTSAGEVLGQLGGRGRVVITASGKMEQAWKSEFTNSVVHGLETGEADLNGDGQVSVDELYHYVHERVQQNRPDQKPTKSVDGMSGELYLAKNPHALLPLPAELEQLLASEIAWKRLWAVDGLRHLLWGDHPKGQKLRSRQALVRLRDGDTDLDVRAAASAALSRAPRRPNAIDHLSPRYHWLVGVSLMLAVVLVLAIAWNPKPPVPVSLPTPSVGPPTPCSPIARPADGVLTLGTLLPKTGQFANSGPAQAAGVRLAMKDITDAGGIPGITVRPLDDTIQRDEGSPDAATAGQPDTTSQSADALLSEVDAIIGPATSAAALKVIDKVTCAGVIMFSPSNTSPVFTTYPSHGLYFRAIPSELEGKVLGKLVVDDHNSTVVVMSRDDPYGNSLREKTKEVIQQAGGQILDSFPYDSKLLDLDKDIQRVKAKKPDAIVLIGFTETAQILKKMINEGLGPRSKRVYVTNMTNTLVSQVDPQHLGALKEMKGTSAGLGNPVFVEQLTKANPGLKDLAYAAQAYDAVVITALAAAVAGTDEPAAVAKEINGVTRAGERCTSFDACMTLVKAHKGIAYEGASGPLRFNDHGEPSTATYVISEIQADGTVKPLRSETVGP